MKRLLWLLLWLFVLITPLLTKAQDFGVLRDKANEEITSKYPELTTAYKEVGSKQRIAFVATVEQPFSIILLIDTSGSTKFRLNKIEDAAITFVSKLKPADSVMVMEFNDRISVLCKPTTDHKAINKCISRIRTGGGTRLYDAVDDVLRKQLKTISGRSAVVLFTDGVDTTSRNSSYESTVRMAAEAGVPIHTLHYDTQDPGPMLGTGRQRGIVPGAPSQSVPIVFPGTTPEERRRSAAYLLALAVKTGGRYYSIDTLGGIGQAFARLADELGRQ